MIECEALWSMDDVAEYLGMSKAFVRQIKDSERLPYIQMGSKIRFNPDSVREWAKNREDILTPTYDRTPMIIKDNWMTPVDALGSKLPRGYERPMPIAVEVTTGTPGPFISYATTTLETPESLLRLRAKPVSIVSSYDVS